MAGPASVNHGIGCQHVAAEHDDIAPRGEFTQCGGVGEAPVSFGPWPAAQRSRNDFDVVLGGEHPPEFDGANRWAG